MKSYSALIALIFVSSLSYSSLQSSPTLVVTEESENPVHYIEYCSENDEHNSYDDAYEIRPRRSYIKKKNQKHYYVKNSTNNTIVNGISSLLSNITTGVFMGLGAFAGFILIPHLL